MATILVVDDEPAARYALRQAFQSEYRVVEAGSVAEARERLASDRPSVVLLDQNMPGEDGLSLLREIGKAVDSPAVVMITAHGSERLAVDAIKAGAYDYLAKPYELDELRLVVARALERQQLVGEVRGLRERLAAEGEFGRMVGNSPAMRNLFRSAAQVAESDLAVMIRGESGTGKDLLAQEIHARSRRADRRFVALNCAALPETLVESELFGFEKGAFTGATTQRAGKFEQAHLGTLFLDEIGDMALGTQAKILRATESGAIERLGSGQAIQVDARLISATNADLDAAIQEGKFRQDLFYRLAGVTLDMPPLRARRADIPLMVEKFWRELQRKYERTGPELTRDIMTRLEEAQWPGNVRQLRNTVEKLFVLGELDPAIASEAPMDGDYREAKRQFEIAYLSRKLREFGGNVTRTAAAIGLERQTLQEKIKQLRIVREG